MSLESVLVKVLCWALGCLCSGLVAYVILGRRVEFIAGQLDRLLALWQEHRELRGAHVSLAEDYHLHKHLPAEAAHPADVAPPASLHG